MLVDTMANHDWLF